MDDKQKGFWFQTKIFRTSLLVMGAVAVVLIVIFSEQIGHLLDLIRSRAGQVNTITIGVGGTFAFDSPGAVFEGDIRVDEQGRLVLVPPGFQPYNYQAVIPGHNSLKGNRINVVFMAGGQPSLKPTDQFDFRDLFIGMLEGGEHGFSAAEDAEGLKGIEPYASNLDRFNFWYLDQVLFGDDDPCNYVEVPAGWTCVDGKMTEPDGWSGYPLSNPQSIYNASRFKDDFDFPNRFVHVFYTPTEYVDAGHSGWGGFSISANSWGVQIPPEVWAEFSTFIHEFTHSLALVYDEKPDPTGKSNEIVLGPNCFSLGSDELTPEQAAASSQLPWHDLIGNGCGQDGIVDCEISPRPENRMNGVDYFDRFDEFIYEVRDDAEGCGAGCMYIKDNIFRPFMGCNVMSSCDLFYKRYDIGRKGSVHALGVINEREACRKIKTLTGGVSQFCKELCLDGCKFGERCVQGTCTPIELIGR